MSFKRGLTRFSQRLFGFSDPSQKRPFLRGDSAGALILQTVWKVGLSVSASSGAALAKATAAEPLGFWRPGARINFSRTPRTVAGWLCCIASLRPSSLFQLGDGRARHPDQLGQLPSAGDGFCGVVTVPESVLVADRSAASVCAAMHSTPAFSSHRRRLAGRSPPGPGSTSGRSVHGKLLAVHELVSPISPCPLPPG
jgi:hypothetical protein